MRLSSRFLVQCLLYLSLYPSPWAVGRFLPHQLSGQLDRRAVEVNTPGIGIELESRGIRFLNNNPKCLPPERGGEADDSKVLKVKGSIITLVDDPQTGPSSDEWVLTAEHSGTEDTTGISRLVPEWIIDGTKVKLVSDPKGGRVGAVARDIRDFLAYKRYHWQNKWAPKKGKQINIKGFEDFGKWTITDPTNFFEAAINLGLQVTAPLPLNSIQDLISIAKTRDRGGNVLLSDRKRNVLHMVRREDFGALQLDQIDQADITDDFLGFFSLVVSYTKATFTVTTPDEIARGPKHSLSIMPRTDFATMYTKEVASKLQRQLSHTPLSEIVKRLASKAGNEGSDDDPKFPRDGDWMDKAVFQWEARPTTSRTDLNTKPLRPRADPNPIDPDTRWDSRDDDVRTGKLLVKTWLENMQQNSVDILAVMDGLLLDGQIGALGPKMESLVFNPNLAAPIFEFRDLGSVTALGLEKSVKGFESAVVQYHNQAAGPTKPGRNDRDVEKVAQGDLTCSSTYLRGSKKGDSSVYMRREEALDAIEKFCKEIPKDVFFKPGGAPIQTLKGGDIIITAEWEEAPHCTPALDFNKDGAVETCQDRLRVLVDECDTAKDDNEFWKAGGTFYRDCIRWIIVRKP